MSITGISYLLLSLGLMSFSWTFCNSWRKTKEGIAAFLSLILSIFATMCLLVAIGGVFFADNPAFLGIIIVVTSFLLTITSAVAAYLSFFFLSAKLSPWIGFFAILFWGLFVSFMTMFAEPRPFIEMGGALNWDLSFPINIFRFSLYLLTFPFLAFIFFRQSRISQNRDIRLKAVALVVVLVIGFLAVLTDFVLEPFLGVPAVTSDIIIGVLGVGILVCFLVPYFNR